MHIKEGIIQAYIDDELDSQQRIQVDNHISACSRCWKKLEKAQERNQRITFSLEQLSPIGVQITPAKTAHIRLVEKIKRNEKKEKAPMFNKWFTRRYRTAWIAGAVMLLLAISMTLAPVRALANSFLGLFRVERVAIVEINPEVVLAQMEGSSANIESLISEYVKFEGEGNPIVAPSAAVASHIADFQVRLPPGMNQEPYIEVIPGGSAEFTIDLAQIRILLDAIGHSDLVLPQVLDGASVTIEIPEFVTTRWGDCRFDSETAREAGFDPDDPLSAPTPPCTALIQVPSPEISGPPGIDLNQLGEIYLQLLGMDQEEAAIIAENIDWASTFVLPIPQYQSSYQMVNIDGVDGTLIQDARGGPHGEYSTVIWVKDGILYALSGPHNVNTIVRLANSVK